MWWILKGEGYPHNPAAVKQMLAYKKKCHNMGPPWVQCDAMWDRVDALAMTRGFDDEFNKAWKAKTKYGDVEFRRCVRC